MDRVSVVVRIKTPGVTMRLHPPPPDQDAPSAHWMTKLASLMIPFGDDGNALRCCLFGTLEEVSSHLWQHQVLWMELCGVAGERHVAVPMTELIEASADLTAGRYAHEVELEEDDSMDGSGKVTVGVSLEAVKDTAGSASVVQPSLTEVFSMHLELAPGHSTLIARAGKAGSGAFGQGRGLRLRCGGVEQPLQEFMHFTLVLVDNWAEVLTSLAALDVVIQAPAESSRDYIELPLNLSALISKAEEKSGTGCISATAKSLEFPSLGESLSFKVSVQSLRWSSSGKPEAGHTQDSELWMEGISSGPRVWRVSVDIRSVRLSVGTKKIFIAYSYEPLMQPRPFRTTPPTLARKNSTAYPPHAFAAYTLNSTTEELRARLEDPLHLEVWERDSYRKDSLIGLVEAAVGPVFDRQIQHSPSMPSMVRGFRVLDRVCPIISSVDSDATRIGTMRLVFFLEDLGPSQDPTKIPPAPAPVPPACQGNASVGPTGTTFEPTPGEPLQEGIPTDVAAASLLQGLRTSPAYATAYELELWKRAEEDRFRAHLAEQEKAMGERLEEEYRQKELARAKEFKQKQAGLREIEVKVRKKLQDLQQREVTIVGDEARLAALKDEMKRRTDLALQEYEDASRRHVAEAQQALQLERSRCRHMESRIAELEADLATARQRTRELEADFDERRRKLEEAPVAKLQSELQSVQFQLREAKAHSEALAASRDHFRHKVEELCRRLLGSTAATAASAPIVGPAGSSPANMAVPSVGPDGSQGADGVVQGLRKIQQDLSQLARDWAAQPSEPVISTSPGRMGGTHVEYSVAPELEATTVAAQDHLAWLRAQHEELLQSGLYSASDPVLVALDARIAEASARRGFGQPGGPLVP